MQKKSENTDRPEQPKEIFASLPYWYFIIPILFLGAWIGGVSFTLYNTLRSTGEIVVSCDRVEPGMITCRRQDNPLLSWFRPTIKTYNHVTSASYKTEEYTDSDGEQHTTYNAILSAHDEDIVIFNSYNRTFVENITNSINIFLQSEKEQFIFKETVRELRSSGAIAGLIIPIIFICVGVFFFMLFLRGLIRKFYVTLRSKKTHIS
ncbi:MAG: hypothetical protein D3911_05050 [Candidatus Electrothrix sp. AW3_4]|nr:hypothetical protein [Candidatus Electrothrix gigas]